MSQVTYLWRGEFTNAELNHLHADAFGHRVYDDEEWDWVALARDHSLGWVTARSAESLVGFVNVLWDGFVHAWLQDEMVSSGARHRGIGLGLIAVARDQTEAAGCEWLHVDFERHLHPFYIDAAGFTPTAAGLIDLTASVDNAHRGETSRAEPESGDRRADATERAGVVETLLDAVEQWREIGELIAGSVDDRDAIASLMEPPFSYSREAAVAVFDMPIRRLAESGRRHLSDQLAEIRAFLADGDCET